MKISSENETSIRAKARVILNLRADQQTGEAIGPIKKKEQDPNTLILMLEEGKGRSRRIITEGVAKGENKGNC